MDDGDGRIFLNAKTLHNGRQRRYIEHRPGVLLRSAELRIGCGNCPRDVSGGVVTGHMDNPHFGVTVENTLELRRFQQRSPALGGSHRR